MSAGGDGRAIGVSFHCDFSIGYVSCRVYHFDPATTSDCVRNDGDREIDWGMHCCGADQLMSTNAISYSCETSLHFSLFYDRDGTFQTLGGTGTKQILQSENCFAPNFSIERTTRWQKSTPAH
jgi:hypothetical protein